MNRKSAFSLFFLLLPAAASAQTSLSADYAKMMSWLSQQMVEPMAFAAGATFDPPQEVKPGRMLNDASFGVGILPLNTSVFPTLQNQTLNDQHVGGVFPQKIPFPELIGHLRMGLPGRSDIALRASDSTIPLTSVTPQTKASAQANMVGVEVRKFFFGGYDVPKLAVSAYANKLWGHFTFQNTLSNVQLGSGAGAITANAFNTGEMDWRLNSVGVNAVVSRQYGYWTPYCGLGYNVASGTLDASLNTTFDTFLATPSQSEQSSRPAANNVRLLLGTQLERKQGRDLFVTGEYQLTGSDTHAFILHLGILFPTHIGPAAKDDAKNPVILEKGVSQKKMEKQNLIFIQ
jgi:hypothetical protein